MTDGDAGARGHPGAGASTCRQHARRSAAVRGGTDVGLDRQDPAARRRRRRRHRRAGHRRSTTRRGATSPSWWSRSSPLNVVYLPRRFVPMKYLLPGVFFLVVFALYPVLYTAYASTTNYGTGHVLSRSQAIDQIQSQSVRPVEGATRYDITPMAGSRRNVRRLRPLRPRVRAAVPRHRDRADRARPRRRPADDAGDDRAHVRRVASATSPACAPARCASLPGYPRPGHVPDAGRDRGRGDHDLRRAGRREHARPGVLRRRRRHDHRRRRPASSTTRRRASSSPTTGPS